MTAPISFPSTTKHVSLPLLFAGQAQKEFFINESLSVIDALLPSIVAGSLAAPPAQSEEGSIFRITAGATLEWAGHDDELAIQIGGEWRFVTPFEGMTVFDQTNGVLLHFRSGWQSASSPNEPSGGAVIDTEARQMLSELVNSLRMLGVFPSAE